MWTSFRPQVRTRIIIFLLPGLFSAFQRLLRRTFYRPNPFPGKAFSEWRFFILFKKNKINDLFRLGRRFSVFLLSFPGVTFFLAIRVPGTS